MTLRLLLILLSLCAVICSDSALSHFREIVTDDIVGGALKEYHEFEQVTHTFTTSGQIKTPNDSLFVGTVESCADQCLFTRFFCRFFMVLDLDGEKFCVMDIYHHKNLNYYFTEVSEGDPSLKLEGAYEIKEEIDNVATITNDPTLLSEDRFDVLLRGYGVSESCDNVKWAELRAILKTCEAALDVPKSRPRNFRKWLGEVGSSYEQVSKRPRLSDTPDSNVLMFLDLFSRVVDPKTHTVYDPDEGTLYIDSPDIQLLIILYKDLDWIWATFGNKVSTDGVLLGGSEARTSAADRDAVVEDFVNAAAKYGHRINNPQPLVQDDYGNCYMGLWRLVTFLTWRNDDVVSDNESQLYQDLSKVVPILYSAPSMPFTEKIYKSFAGEHINIITQRK